MLIPDSLDPVPGMSGGPGRNSPFQKVMVGMAECRGHEITHLPDEEARAHGVMGAARLLTGAKLGLKPEPH